MTVQTNTNVASFNGNGVTQIFPIAFKFNNDTDLVVLLVDDDTGMSSQLTLNSDYTVSGEGDEEGGLINVVVAPAVGQRLKVLRIVDILQLLDLRNQGKFFAEVHEDAFDLLTMIAQQHESSIRSALRVAESDPEPARLPPVASRANRLLSFDALGNPIATAPASGSTSDLALALADSVDPAKGAEMIGWRGRTVADRLGESLTLDDFGAKGTGTDDDWQAIQGALTAGACVHGRPGAVYSVSKRLTASVAGARIHLNGATIKAASGFTDDNLLLITESNVQIYGPGELDGTNLPAISAGFDGTSFKGITVYYQGTGGSRLDGIVVADDVIIKSGQAGSLAAYYCTEPEIRNVIADGAATVSGFASAALQFFHECAGGQYKGLTSKNAKWKGFSWSSCTNFVASTITATGDPVGNALVFAVNSLGFVINGVVTKGGFGIKADRCFYGEISNIDIDCGGVGEGGVMLQGCDRVRVRGGTVRDFTSYGLHPAHHTTGPTNAVDCEFSGLTITRSGTVQGDGSMGVYLGASTANGIYGLKLHDLTIRSVDLAFSCILLAGAQIDNIDISDCRLKDIKRYAGYGPMQSASIRDTDIEDSINILDVWHLWSGSQGSRLSIVGGHAYNIGASARWVKLESSASKLIQYEYVQLGMSVINGGGRYIDIALGSSSSRIKTLEIIGVLATGAASASGFNLDSSSDTTTQVMIANNSLYASNLSSKQTISFIQTAASGKWNGVVENNMAVISNKPNNV